MTTLKSRYVLKQLETGVLTEIKANELLVEAINDDLLRKFTDALAKGEELEDLLGSVDLKIFLKILKQINLLVKNDLKKSTDFFGGDTLLRNKVKKWLQAFWKNSTIERQEKFIEDLDNNLKQIVKHLTAILPKYRRNKDQALNKIPDIDQHEQKTIYDMIVNACHFRDPDERISSAVNELANILFDIGIEQIITFSDLVSQIRVSVNQDVQGIENIEQKMISDKPESHDEENLNDVNIDQKLDINNVIDTFVKLDKNTYNVIMRAINAKRKLNAIKI
jgi:hypothetical protein